MSASGLVLIVDDEELNRKLLREPLTSQGCQVDEADCRMSLLYPLESQTVLQQILGQVETVFGDQVCSVFLVDPASGKLSLKAQKGYDPNFMGAARGGIGKDGIVNRVASTGKPEYVPDVRREAGNADASPRVRSEAALPLIVGGEIMASSPSEALRLMASEERCGRCWRLSAPWRR